MKIKTLVLVAVLFSAIFLTCLCTGEMVEIAGMQIPLIEDAVPAKRAEAQTTDAKILVYTVDKPLSEVIKFYESFFAENNFLLIGGKQGGAFNASVKKGETMFTLMIYSQNNQTIIQFIW